MGSLALQVHAGPRARALLRERGLRALDVKVVPAAAGGPKGLVLLPLDAHLFGSWMARTPQTVHLLGASIGAWRMACACLPAPVAAFEQLAEDYITQRYEHLPGRPPEPAHVSEVFGGVLRQRLGAHSAALLSHPTRRLHVFTSHGRRLLSRGGRLRTPLGYLGAFLTNAVHRPALGAWLERVVFSDPRDPLPIALTDLRTQVVPLQADNLHAAVLASCSIPFWLDPVHDIPGAPPGAYWDGGITDYHLHLRYSSLREGLVLYPHFQSRVVPGWFDKAWTRRHRPTPWLDNLVVLSPSPQWASRLPGGKIPDRGDFKSYGDDAAGRMKVWRLALEESRRLVDDFAELASRTGGLDALPLA